jgi:ankyrin repeat protein
VIVLINNGANVDTTDDNGQTPLRGASVRGYEGIVEVLENKKTEEKKADEREAKNKEVEGKYAEGKRKRGRTTGKEEIGKTDMPKRRKRKIEQ